MSVLCHAITLAEPPGLDSFNKSKLEFQKEPEIRGSASKYSGYSKVDRCLSTCKHIYGMSALRSS